MENIPRINVKIDGKTYAIKNYHMDEEEDLLTVDVAFCDPEYKCVCCGYVSNKKEEFKKDYYFNAYACKRCVEGGNHEIDKCTHCGVIIIDNTFDNDFKYCPECMEESKKKYKQEQEMKTWK
jgi:hypothetical protein